MREERGAEECVAGLGGLVQAELPFVGGSLRHVSIPCTFFQLREIAVSGYSLFLLGRLFCGTLLEGAHVARPGLGASSFSLFGYLNRV